MLYMYIYLYILIKDIINQYINQITPFSLTISIQHTF